MLFIDAYLSWMILFADHLHFPLSLHIIWRRDHIPHDSIHRDKQRLMVMKSSHQLGGSINIGSVGLFLLCFTLLLLDDTQTNTCCKLLLVQVCWGLFKQSKTWQCVWAPLGAHLLKMGTFRIISSQNDTYSCQSPNQQDVWGKTSLIIHWTKIYYFIFC